MEYSRTQIDLLQVKPSSLEPYPGPFLEPGITKRIRMTAFLRSLARPDKRAYRKAAKAATGEATTYAQRNCSKYFEFSSYGPSSWRAWRTTRSCARPSCSRRRSAR